MLINANFDKKLVVPEMKDLKQTLSATRTDYDSGILTEEKLIRDPFEQFKSWMNLAIQHNVPEINAMTLSTVDTAGRPVSRIVLLKGLEEKGFVFFTNYESRKGHELTATPYAALNFFWPALQKQVRIEGKVEKIEESASDAYFKSRPRESQIGAWSSSQSTIIESRDVLEQKFTALTNQFEGKEIPKPENWGGFCVIPYRMEFWQGRPSRLHDRFQFELINNNWKIDRLSP